MTVIKINAITVSSDSADELARRFAARAGAVDNQDGFEGFELLQPTDERTTWPLVTRWRDEESLNAWMSSPLSVRVTGPRPSSSARFAARRGPSWSSPIDHAASLSTAGGCAATHHRAPLPA